MAGSISRSGRLEHVDPVEAIENTEAADEIPSSSLAFPSFSASSLSPSSPGKDGLLPAEDISSSLFCFPAHRFVCGGAAVEDISPLSCFPAPSFGVGGVTAVEDISLSLSRFPALEDASKLERTLGTIGVERSSRACEMLVEAFAPTLSRGPGRLLPGRSGIRHLESRRCLHWGQ